MFSLRRCRHVCLYLKRNNCSHLNSEIDFDYYCNPANATEIQDNIICRKGIGNINEVLNVHKQLKETKENKTVNSLKAALNKLLLQIPNKTHPDVKGYGSDPKIIKLINEKPVYVGDPLDFSAISRRLNFVRSDQLGNTCGNKSYYLMGDLAELEEALIKYTVATLLKDNFELISVPDVIPGNILESCGMTIHNDRTQIYSLDPDLHGPDQYLSGTAEIALAGLLKGKTFHAQDLPAKFAAVSRCYRAETSNVVEQRGIYRVHQFTKVEMFVVSSPDKSDETLEDLCKIEENLFQPLGFHMQVLDMPPKELGAPAYRKYDIEAWMPGRKSFGEISSCSNCTDYQSRRLGIKYDNGINTEFVHTLNGTACAIPRMLIALIETHQKPKGKILIPEVLQCYMDDKQYICRNTNIPELKILKIKH